MTVSAIQKLNSFYEQFQGDDRVLIPINADPDSIASAMAIKRLLWRKVSKVIISNINIIDRPDNLAMVNLIGIQLVHIRDIDFKLFNRYVLVDAQADHHECFALFRPDVTIDHHPKTCEVGRFCDIRPGYGATASILTEYLRAARIKPSAKLATGLFYAIKTDTSNFERQTLIEDVRAFQYLFRFANMPLARRIEQADLNPSYLQFFKHAIESRRMRRGKLYVHLGDVPTPDICVIIAEFFMRVHTVKWCIVSGLHDQKLILIFRNDGLRKHAGKVAQKSYGHIGSAGGHKSMARAEIDLAELKKLHSYENDTQLITWIMNQVNRRAE